MNSYKQIIYIATDNHPVFFEKLSSIIKEIDNLKPVENWQKLFVGFAAMVDGTGTLAQIASTSVISTWKQSQLSESESVTPKTLNNDGQSLDKAIKTLKQFNLEKWKSLVESISLSSIPDDLEFPPGHPLPEHLYRVHPLKTKINKYIPIEAFDDLLYDEREAELINLLADLGATKITFQDVSNQSNKYGANAEVKITGAGGIEGNGEHQKNQSQNNSQLIKLRGKPWTPNMTIDKEKYSWLSYEPSWERLVHTRLAGALSTTIELTTDDSYSISGQFKLAEGLLQKIGALGSGATITQSFQKKKLFEVEFADSI
ncbi:hypothetical protein DSM106972_064640 [Dulcicalothrix desertica PCC 7102]|uniref:Uncharacterized protein n=1 Tax=Dulcicalothrix desertica PCC 7102 TaxID=232991 RepID=A0A433V6Y5_9CYAN|nr:hypothetical protein [Dulcicalothrix desertica]RUT01841.1 hypothetical protein DSM106972_064640 [Dulcicalothrix desertica PCC 7102]TWH42994.1 hypothetical protein CAL7102_06684 [Dulcicalothrix desertica PCC 7102]